MIEDLATGRWLTDRRVAMIARLSLGATVLMVLFLFATATGTRDFAGRPLGTDFSNVWTAGHLATLGQAPLAWDWEVQHAAQQAVHHDPAIPFYGWHYPPPFLLIAAALAHLPYVPALILWQATTLFAALMLVRRIVPGRRTLLVAAAAPVVLVCIGHGHNGFLTAALFGGGLMLLDRRPLAAGLLLGCLVYKPQFAVLLPLTLLAGGHWRAIAGAALSSLALVGLTLAIWGWPVWAAFLDSLPLTRSVVIEAGSTGWEKIQTVFGAVRSLGGGVEAAYAVQACVSALAIAAALAATRWGGPATRNAAVLAAALLSTPYALDYDYTILGVAIAFLIADGRARGVLRWEATLLGLCWAAPLFARSIAAATLVPIGLVTALVVATLAARRFVVLDQGLRAIARQIRSSPCRRSRAASAR